MIFTRINVNLFPKDGYVFKDGSGVVFKANSWSNVITKVIEYRRRAGLPIGDPKAEVEDYACKRNPTLCRDNTQRPVVVPPISLKARALQWLNRIAQVPKADLIYVNAAEAEQRAAVCSKCPNNQLISADTCSSCKKAFTTFREMLIGNRSKAHNLGACVALGSDLVAAVHLDEVRVDNPSLPAHCWRRKSI